MSESTVAAASTVHSIWPNSWLFAGTPVSPQPIGAAGHGAFVLVQARFHELSDLLYALGFVGLVALGFLVLIQFQSDIRRHLA